MKTNTVSSKVSFSIFNSKLVSQFPVIPLLFSIIRQPLQFSVPLQSRILNGCFNSYDFLGRLRSLLPFILSADVWWSWSACLGTYPIVFYLLTRIVPSVFLVSFASLNIITYVLSDRPVSFISDTTSRNFQTNNRFRFDQTSQLHDRIKRATLETYVYFY